MMIYNWILKNIDILGLTIDFLALIITILLTIVIYKLERRHERDQEKIEEKAKSLALKESAKVFLIDNDEEVEYLPLADVAARLKLKRKHCRTIITRYLKCNEQLQQEILLQAQISESRISCLKLKWL